MNAWKYTFGITKSCDKSTNFTGLVHKIFVTYEGWNFNSGNYLFTTDTK